MVGKRHASDEITAKMAQAKELAAKGKTQREISKALGVSIMTYYRWKKALDVGEYEDNGPAEEPQLQISTGTNLTEVIKRLTLENSQLRRLVTDTLLERLRLEDELRTRQEARFRRSEKR